MSGVLDVLDKTPRRQSGKNGAGYVIIVDANGLPYGVGNLLPVSLEGATVTVTATIPGTVEITNDAGNPLPARDLVLASDGAYINPDDGAQTLNYTGDVLNYIQVTLGALVYRQTMTYTATKLTGISKWTLQ